MVAAAALAGAAAWACGAKDAWVDWAGDRELAEKYRFAPVSRTRLEGSLKTPGRLESTRRTLIKCEVENITIRALGRELNAGGASTLLTVIPEGSTVKAGDVLATLDSSGYEELLRQQRMTVERARADHRQTVLDLEAAELALAEYRDGLMAETLSDHNRLIALAESEVARSKDRLDWASRLKGKGYVAASVAATEKQTHAKAQVALDKARGARDLFERFTARKAISQLEGTLYSRQASLRYHDLRLTRHLDRLAMLERQVEGCTIRAPHDGFVIYVNDPRRGEYVEAGAPVRQQQDLFYLPDLSKMEVVAVLHESIVDRVKPGMAAEVAVESQPGRRLTGRVRSVAPLPKFDERLNLYFFESTVVLDGEDHRSLLPGMTVQVDLSIPPRPGVLAVPPEAVAREGGADFCYVASDEGDRLEKRRVALGQVTPDMQEIAEGLEEGERVVLNPRPDDLADDVAEGPGAPPSAAPAPAGGRSPAAPILDSRLRRPDADAPGPRVKVS